MRTLKKFIQLLSPPPAAAQTPLGALDRLIRVVCLIYPRVPAAILPGAARQALSGYLFPEGPDLVIWVAHALERHRALFAHIPESAAALRADLKRAQRYATLRDLCLDLAARADTQYALGRSGVVHRALLVVFNSRSDASKPFASASDRERMEALDIAELMLGPRRGRGLIY